MFGHGMNTAQTRRMGLMYVTVRVTASHDARRVYEAPFLVDTGATDSMAPASALVDAGIRPMGTRRYQLADGSYVDYPFGLAHMEFLCEPTAGRIIFGPEDADPILGVTQLESAGISIDPVNQTLKRLPAISLRTLERVARSAEKYRSLRCVQAAHRAMVSTSRTG
jgi:clan AA aspartic protease